MADNGQVAWEDPPPLRVPAPPPNRWVALLEPLKQRPAQWAKVRTYQTGSRANSMARHLRKRHNVTIPDGRFEFTSRKLPDGTGAVYARYLGPEEPAP